MSDNATVTKLKQPKYVGQINVTKKQLAFLDKCFNQIGAQRDTAASFADLAEQLDVLLAKHKDGES